MGRPLLFPCAIGESPYQPVPFTFSENIAQELLLGIFQIIFLQRISGNQIDLQIYLTGGYLGNGSFLVHDFRSEGQKAQNCRLKVLQIKGYDDDGGANDEVGRQVVQGFTPLLMIPRYLNACLFSEIAKIGSIKVHDPVSEVQKSIVKENDFVPQKLDPAVVPGPH